MQYTRVSFTYNPPTETVRDVLSAMLAEAGFNAFMDKETMLEAYIPSEIYRAEEVDRVLAEFPMESTISYEAEEIEDRDWNEEWEKNYFRPIAIHNKLCIHSSFHEPEGNYPYRIMIDPKMSFGTGHHQTTRLMLEELLNMDLTGKTVLDMGCGTGVLAILASMKGAVGITAIDIDEWAYSNAVENARLNNIQNIAVKQGGAELLVKEKKMYDVVTANISRNILLEDIPTYAKVLKRHGWLFISGFYQHDIPLLKTVAEEVGLTFQHTTEMGEWVAVAFCDL